ncbi:MAG: hypothetical protein VB934_22100 [Polyangiaceae bacterium]
MRLPSFLCAFGIAAALGFMCPTANATPIASSSSPSAGHNRNTSAQADGADSTEEALAHDDDHRFVGMSGFRGQVITHPGMDPYSTGDFFSQITLGAAFLPLTWGHLKLGVLSQYDMGSVDTDTRGIPASLSIHRIGAGPYAQVSLGDRWRLSSRVIPGANYLDASFDDTSGKLRSQGWTWSLETSVGAAVRLGSAGKSDDPKASFWLTADLGYTFAGTSEMSFTGDLEQDDPRDFGTIELPPLSPRGFSQRLAFAVSF